MSPIDPAIAAALPDSLRFAKYVRRAAERGACAVTLTGEDFAQLAGMIHEAQTVLSAGALDVSDLAAWTAQSEAIEARAEQLAADAIARLEATLARHANPDAS
jgi:hypothetical protein